MTIVVKRGKESLEFTAPSLRVGTHSTCDLVLDDPLAADLHATITWSGRGAEVEPGESSLGTYLDGEPVSQRTPLHEGSELVVGASRIRVDAVDVAAGTLTLTVDECSFFHVAKRRGEFHSDADEWVRSETRFGRILPLRWLNLVAVLIVVTGIATSLSKSSDRMGASRAAWASAGPLSEVHARVFAEIASGDHAYSAAVASTASRGCAACHTAGRVDYVTGEGCLQCHVDAIAAMAETAAHGGRHPFQLETAAADCQDCHREHRGGARPVHVDADSTRSCESCHGSAQSELNLPFLQGAAAEAFRTPAPTRGFEGFSHGSHAKVACVACHEPSGGDLLSATNFSVPDTVGSCLACHGADVPRESSASIEPSFQVSLSEEQHAQHGEGLCTKCHEAALEPALLAMLGPVPTARRVDVPGHAHATLIETAECRSCHLKPIEPAAPRSEAVYDHALHLGWGSRGRTGASRPATQAACTTCHVGMDSAGRHASGSAAWATCAGCHDDRAFTPPAPLPLAPAGERLAEFTHAAHGSRDCAECHVVRGAAGAPLDVARLVDGVTCATCHFDHGSKLHRSAPGTEDCDRCHGALTSGAAMFAGASLRRSEREPRPTSGFSHAVEGHRVNSSDGCATCHRGPESEVVVANEGGQLCLDCHQRRRFHWRYSSPK